MKKKKYLFALIPAILTPSFFVGIITQSIRAVVLCLSMIIWMIIAIFLANWAIEKYFDRNEK